MKILIENKEAKKYANELWSHPRTSGKELVRLVNLKFGKGTAIRRRLTNEEWIEHYKFWLDKNIRASAPTLIIEKLRERLKYWKKRRKNNNDKSKM